MSELAYFMLLIILLYQLNKSNSLELIYVNLTFEEQIYKTYIGSPSVKITCFGTNLNPSDIVWIVNSHSTPIAQKVIYSDSTYIGDSARKYSIEIINSIGANNSNIPGVFNMLKTSLTIYDINQQDILNGYECVCNIYKKCSNTNHAMSNTSLILVEPSTTTYFYRKSNEISYCSDGFYSQSQFILIILSLIVLIVSSILFHCADFKKSLETYVSCLILVVSFLCLLAAIVIWTNFGDKIEMRILPLLFIAISLPACFLLIFFDIFYVIRLMQKKEMTLAFFLIILVNFIFMLLSICLIVVSNIICTGYAITISANETISFEILETIGSGSFLFFSFLLFLASCILYYFKYNNKIQRAVPNSRFFIVNNSIRPSNKAKNNIITVRPMDNRDCSILSIERSFRYNK